MQGTRGVHASIILTLAPILQFEAEQCLCSVTLVVCKDQMHAGTSPMQEIFRGLVHV